jgi:hypothetical protein
MNGSAVSDGAATDDGVIIKSTVEHDSEQLKQY